MVALSIQGFYRVVTTKRTEISILHGYDLELQGGGLTAVVGHSGSRRSSLLMCLSGLNEPTSDTVTINGRDACQQSVAKHTKMLRSEVGFAFQQYNPVSFLTIEENITLPFLPGHEPTPRDLVRDPIRSFDLSRCSRTPAHLLSGGEQQRTALCRAPTHHPGIVFADEPTGALGSQSAQIVLGTLRRMADKGQMIIMITHDLDVAAMVDRIVIMHDDRTMRYLGHYANQELLRSMTDPKA